MAKKEGAKPASLDHGTADKLLDLLSTDNAYRRLFKKDPAAALAQIGYQAPEGAVSPSGCMAITTMATKASIVQSRDALKSLLTSGLSMTPIQLNAETTASRRTRK